MSLAPDDPRHGTATGYDNWGCRCDQCREAWRVYRAAKVRERAETTTCPNCDGPGGLYANNTCSACWEYEHTHGVPRPSEVYARAPKPPCVHCGRKIKPNRGGHGRCEACYVYHRRHGVDRPDHLLNPPTHCAVCWRGFDKVNRRGTRCAACAAHFERYGQERPKDKPFRRAGERRWCSNCAAELLPHKNARGRCMACYEYKRRTGVERPSPKAWMPEPGVAS